MHRAKRPTWYQETPAVKEQMLEILATTVANASNQLRLGVAGRPTSPPTKEGILRSVAKQAFTETPIEDNRHDALVTLAKLRIDEEFDAHNEIEVDDDAAISKGTEDGNWVAAWIWVPNK